MPALIASGEIVVPVALPMIPLLKVRAIAVNEPETPSVIGLVAPAWMLTVLDDEPTAALIAIVVPAVRETLFADEPAAPLIVMPAVEDKVILGAVIAPPTVNAPVLLTLRDVPAVEAFKVAGIALDTSTVLGGDELLLVCSMVNCPTDVTSATDGAKLPMLPPPVERVSVEVGEPIILHVVHAALVGLIS